VYAQHWYLNCVAKNWGVLVLNHYEAVMPICWNKKFGISYSYTPPWVQQLGIFSSKPMDESMIFAFLEAIPTRFKKVDLQLNSFNNINHPKIKLRTNLLLNLEDDYQKIYQRFNKNRKRCLKQLAALGKDLEIECIDEAMFLIFFKSVQKKYVVNAASHESIKKLLNSKKGHCIGVFEGASLLGALFYFVAHNRIYYLLPLSSARGLELNVQTLIIDHIIKKFGGRNYTLDFEGSMVEGVARFYKSFGAKEELYPMLSYWRI
jgi:hypothetical protein